MEFQICCDCQYLGDKFSFPMPNDKIDMDKNNPHIKHYKHYIPGDINFGARALSRLFGVHHSTIERVLVNKTWRHTQVD